MKPIFTTAILIFFGQMLWAQQLPFLAQYRENHILINPASISVNYTNNNSALSTGFLGRYQWMGMPDAPRTQTAYGSYLWEDQNFGFGGFLINDQTGPIGFSGVYGQLAYVLELSSYGHKISGGLNIGIVQYRAKFQDNLNFTTENDPQVINNSQIYPDVGAGIYYHYDKYFYAGLSVPQVLGLNLNYKTPNNEFQIQRLQHVYFVMGGYIGIGEESFLEPSTWIQYVPNGPVNINLNLRMLIPVGQNFEMWFGGGYSVSGMGHLEGGFTLTDLQLFGEYDGLKFGLSYDRTFADYAPYATGAYELHVGYYIDI